MAKPTNFSTTESLEVVWEALYVARSHLTGMDPQWDDICTAMAWITEALGTTSRPVHHVERDET